MRKDENHIKCSGCDFTAVEPIEHKPWKNDVEQLGVGNCHGVMLKRGWLGPFLQEERAKQEAGKFHKAVVNKFLKVAKEKNRSLEPWKDYDAEFLLERLREEWDELTEAIIDEGLITTRLGTKIGDQIKDELIDVAAFCMFLWLKLEEYE